MGNNVSQSGNIAQRQLDQEQQWAHSFPRTPQRFNQQHKVLPDVSGDVHQKLRPTNNGEILYSGGTISGRHHSSNLSLSRDDSQNGVYRSSSISSRHPQEYNKKKESPKERYYIPHQRENARSPSRRTYNIPTDLQHPHGHFSHQKDTQMKRFGSVPDLRGRDIDSSQEHVKESRASRARKKYKAPPPPGPNNVVQSNGSSLDSWDMNGEVLETPIRKTRLFKTRAEMKKKAPSPQNNSSIYTENIQNDDVKRYRSKSREIQKKIPESLENDRTKKANGNLRPVMLSEMQRSKSLPEFQAELKEVTQRVRTSKLIQSRQEERKSMPAPQIPDQKTNKHNNIQRHSLQETKETKLKTLDPNKKEHIKYKMKQIEKSHKVTKPKPDVIPKVTSTINNKKNTTPVTTNIEGSRGRASGKESTTPEQSPIQKPRDKSESREQPSKTFYFGMDEPGVTQPNSFNSTIVDHFALSIRKHNCILPTQTYSASDLSSSEIEADENQVSTNGIALLLRPILPKKQLEIPRFSPAAAWRLLTAFDSNPPPSTVSDEGPVLIEDRIEKLARQPPLLSIPGVGPRSSHDKSGDSGISGDAGIPGFEDNSDPIQSNARNNNIQIPISLNLSWTPQQDLGEEESSSEGGTNNRMYSRSTGNVKFTPRSQVFSLSLPRDNHLAAYMEEKAKLHSPPSYTNLQRLKRSVSGVLGNIGGKIKETNPSATQDQNENWFLSRSAPNSLNNGFNSLEIRLSKHNNNILTDTLDERHSLVPFNVKNPTNSNGGRVMYLPECKENDNYNSYSNERQKLIQYATLKKDNFKSNENIDNLFDDTNHNKLNYRLSSISKSCENISTGTAVSKSLCEPEDLQDPPPVEDEIIKWKGRKPKRFTFQSTVRQIERRRLAEKLSREAERKEQQRLSELEAMRRVEEEFQKKRAKEKASIRQQLRMFSLDNTVWSSLPPVWDNKDVPARSEPDGAVSSSASSPTHDSTNNKLMDGKHSNYNTDHTYNETKIDNLKKITSQKNTDSKSSPIFKKILSRQGSESSDDTRIKAQATQVLSEFRQPIREYKDYRASSRCLVDGNDLPYHDMKQTTIHPQVIYNIPKAQGSNVESAARSNNYRRDFAHGIMLPGKSSDSFSEETQSNARKHSPRITQNQRSRQGKCIS